MNRYLMRIKPVGLFFFGNENKYRYRKNTGGFQADYYQRSRYLPQQTTILGMLRYLILENARLIPVDDRQKASALIGEHSFQVDKCNGFGVIESLSPVFIIKGEDWLMPAPFDTLLPAENEPGSTFKPMKYHWLDARNNFSGSGDRYPVFDDFSEKKGIANGLVSTGNDHTCYSYTHGKNPLWLEEEKIGITKGKKGKTREDAFYKQILYTFKDGDTSFAVTVDFKPDYQPPQWALVSLGAEKYTFKVTFEPVDYSYADKISQEAFAYNTPKLILLSDTFLDWNGNHMPWEFAITRVVPFRHLLSDIGVQYYGRFGKQGGLSRSNRYQLFERGSVFFFNDNSQLDAFAGMLQNEKNFYQIGYNHFIKIHEK